MPETISEMKWTEFIEEGKRRFGPNKDDWRFQCVACGHVQSIADYIKRHPEAERREVGGWIFYSCEGRHDRQVGCNWSLGGLLHIQERMLTDTGTEAGSCPAFLFDGETPGSPPFYTPREKPPTKGHPHDK